MRTRNLAVVMAMFISLALHAQIPQEVTDVLKKCTEKMENVKGMKMEADLNMRMALVFSMNGKITVYSKGGKSFVKTSVKVFGQIADTESGFDGTQQWTFIPKTSKEESDTLKIKKTDKKSKEDFDMTLDMDKEYKKAKMRVKKGKYEITFTEPKNDHDPKKTVVLINQNDYSLYQFQVKMGVASAKITVNRISYGVNDDLFVLDTKKYPNAVIVRE
ncbi:MAG: hypothetical protein K6F94_05185 [Bacteroidaceae bacterium]|nr:hypothetical protein [Bacteroidaceae bacterium]